MDSSWKADGVLWSGEDSPVVQVPAGVRTIGIAAFQSLQKLHQVILPDSLQVIREGAFRFCLNLADVAMHQGLRSIGTEVFSSCTALESVNLPEGLLDIGARAFQSCTGLRSVGLPASLRSLGQEAFSGCRKLQECSVPGSVGVLAPELFAECSQLKQVSLGEGIREIGSRAFHGCTSLTEIRLPEGVEVLGAEAFRNCTSLRRVSIPASLKQLSPDTFAGCGQLEEVVLVSGSPWLRFQNGMFLTADGKTVLACAPGPADSLQVPDGVTRIAPRAFQACDLMELLLPDSVEEVGEHAFTQSRLVRIQMGAQIRRLPEGMAEHCHWLKMLVLPQALEELGENCLADTVLRELVLPAQVRTLADSCLRNTFLRHLTVLGDLSALHFSSLDLDTDKLELTVPGVRVQDQPQLIREMMLRSFVSQLDKGDSLPQEQQAQLADWLSLEYRTGWEIPCLRSFLLQNCTLPAAEYRRLAWQAQEAQDAELLAQIQAAQSQHGCPEDPAEEVVFLRPAAGAASQDDTFLVHRQRDRTWELRRYQGRDSQVAVPDRIGTSRVTTVGPGAFSPEFSRTWFEGKDVPAQPALLRLRKVELPEGVRILGEGAFAGCASLEQVTLPSTLQEIRSFAFSKCPRLRKVALPRGLKYVGRDAFAGCAPDLEVWVLGADTHLMGESSAKWPEGWTLHALRDTPAWNFGQSQDIRVLELTGREVIIWTKTWLAASWLPASVLLTPPSIPLPRPPRHPFRRLTDALEES